MEQLKLEKITKTLFIYQKKGVFSYGTDAVALCNYIKKDLKNNTSKKTMCDLCSGTGIIPLMLCDSIENLTAHAVEINETAYSLSQMSAEQSNLSNRYFAYNQDINNVRNIFAPEQFDFVTCNPPYMTNNCGKMCDYDYKTIARHEIYCTIDDVFKSASYLLRTGGNIYIVYRAERLSSLFKAAENNNFQIKDMCAVVTKELPSVVKLIVCKAQKGANEGLTLNACDIQNLR